MHTQTVARNCGFSRGRIFIFGRKGNIGQKVDDPLIGSVAQLLSGLGHLGHEVVYAFSYDIPIDEGACNGADLVIVFTDVPETLRRIPFRTASGEKVNQKTLILYPPPKAGQDVAALTHDLWFEARPHDVVPQPEEVKDYGNVVAKALSELTEIVP